MASPLRVGALALLLVQCNTPRSGAVQDTPRASATAPAPSAPVAAISASASNAVPVPADAGQSAVAVLPHYPDIAVNVPSDCKDPRVVLAVRKEYDRSGRVLVQQTLVANPEFKVVREQAKLPLEVDLYETIYGPSKFSRNYVGEPRFSEAVIARCAEVDTCRSLGRAFHAVSQADQPLVVCGVPPATTGGFKRVPELVSTLLAPPPPKAARAWYCARVQACTARVSATPRPSVTCAEVGSELGRCASLQDCQAVSDCVQKAGK